MLSSHIFLMNDFWRINCIVCLSVCHCLFIHHTIPTESGSAFGFFPKIFIYLCIYLFIYLFIYCLSFVSQLPALDEKKETENSKSDPNSNPKNVCELKDFGSEPLRVCATLCWSVVTLSRYVDDITSNFVKLRSFTITEKAAPFLTTM